jgi:Protein of unknown function (DUF2786)
MMTQDAFEFGPDTEPASNGSKATAELEKEKRTALLDKISALLAKTEQNGCTEAEAIAAADLAQKLMAKYGLSLSEIQAIESPTDACEMGSTPIGKRRCHEVYVLMGAIAFFTDTRTWYNGNGVISMGGGRLKVAKHDGVNLVYFGLPADVQVAIFLTNTLRVALDTEWANFWQSYPERPKPNASTARSSFMYGMTSRLSSRLYQMKREQDESDENDCRAIVLAKTEIVEAAYRETGVRPRSRSSNRNPLYGRDEVSLNAGSNAGDRVGICTRVNHHIEAR